MARKASSRTQATQQLSCPVSSSSNTPQQLPTKERPAPSVSSKRWVLSRPALVSTRYLCEGRSSNSNFLLRCSVVVQMGFLNQRTQLGRAPRRSTAAYEDHVADSAVIDE